jgi:hypothetical protein
MRNEMLRNGVSPRITVRMIAELSDHFDDLEADALRAGAPAPLAGELAGDRLGEPACLIAEVAKRRDLKLWVYRFPRISRAVLPIAWLLLLPVAPVFAGVAHVSSVFRWAAALLLGGLVTAAMLLMLQLSISLG